MGSLSPRLLTALLAALLCWAPLPFGSVMPGARFGLLVAATVAFLIALTIPGDTSYLRPIRLPAMALVGVALWGLVQAAPLPASWARWMSPESARLQAQAAQLLGHPAPHLEHLSLAPDVTFDTALWWAALAAVFVAAGVCGRIYIQRRWLLWGLLASALFQALYGARRWNSAASQIWGTTVPGDPGRLRGTFVNSDHLALFLELALTVTFAWLWWSNRRARQAVTLERRLLLLAPPIIVWLTLFACLAFTGSRAGLAAALAATGLQGVLLVVRRRRWRLGTVGLGLGLLGLGVVAAIGLQQGLGRWLATSPYEITWNVRGLVYHATWRLWLRFPLTGVGLGAFRASFRLVQPAAAPGGWWHAHNDWLELLATTGVVGSVLFLCGLFFLLRRLRRILISDARSEERAAALAALGALGAVAVHSCFDFGLTMPANALALAILTGAATATPARRLGRRRHHAPTPDESRQVA